MLPMLCRLLIEWKIRAPKTDARIHPELASHLRSEERELEAGGGNL
ncbi:MAG TPA: hypothetical protein VFU34_00495 [Gaiellaceae bacterium]|nr:hypothetical protein [Gaiellaceae bacterium]